MGAAFLLGCLLYGRADRRDQAGVRVEGHELEPGQAAGDQAAEEALASRRRYRRWSPRGRGASGARAR